MASKDYYKGAWGCPERVRVKSLPLQETGFYSIPTFLLVVVLTGR